MACRGVFYAITATEAEHLLSQVGNDRALAGEVLGYYSDERRKAHFIAPIDTAWDPIHRCLTDGSLRGIGSGTTPLSWCVLGGRNLHPGKNYVICYVEPEKVSQIAQAADEITPQWFSQKYWNLEASGYRQPVTREDFEHTWEYFIDARGLYTRAAADNRAVVFMADQ